MSYLDPYRCRHSVLEPKIISTFKVELRCKFCKELIGWWENSQEDTMYSLSDEERQRLV